MLTPFKAIDALDRNVAHAALEVASVAGRLEVLPPDDARRLFIGQELFFTLQKLQEPPNDESAADKPSLRVVGPDGRARDVVPPWRLDNRFGVAHLGFGNLTREPIESDADRADLARYATTLGISLFELLFDPPAIEHLGTASIAGAPIPVATIRSDNDFLLSLPWELLHNGQGFLVRDGRLELVRTTLDDAAGVSLLKPPDKPFHLVVNVSAPEGSGLSYEKESYRIALALTDRCPMTPTELGTLDDLAATVAEHKPTGVHFSGHGGPAALQFEDEEGRGASVSITEVVKELRLRAPDRLPPFFYLACCHGNEPGSLADGRGGSESSAAALHRAGVPQVVGYYGPVRDMLSTQAEEALYTAIAAGQSTRYAVRQARRVLAAGQFDPMPFAWSQLVFYHRGPDYPLGEAVRKDQEIHRKTLRRTFLDAGDRRILVTGFVGRRTDMHRARRRIRDGQRVFVFQGLGGLGKSTLALEVLKLLGHREEACVLWCQDTEDEPNQAEALVGQLLSYCRRRFGLDWEGVVQQVDRTAGDDPARRFVSYLQTLVQNSERIVLYLDNLESLLVGPADDRSADQFAEWRHPTLTAIWQAANDLAENHEGLHVVASCRYRHEDFRSNLIPVSPLPADALLRLTEWFPALGRLTWPNRARLADRLDGHPRAVEYANDLVQNAIDRHRERVGQWSVSSPPTREEVDREWHELVEPALPKVRDKLESNLLLAQLWDRVLEEPARRMLFRMSLLRGSWGWELVQVLGDPDQADTEAVAERLRGTSLLEQVEALTEAEGRSRLVSRYTLHPATVEFIRQHFAGDAIAQDAHRRIGEFLEAQIAKSPLIETGLEAGHHLFHAGLYDRACELLVSVSNWLQDRGWIREGLRVLEPFVAVQSRMQPPLVGPLLGTVGLAYSRLGEERNAIRYNEHALVIYREIGDRRGEGAALGNMGLAYHHLGEVPTAIRYYEQAIAIDHDIGNWHGECAGLGNLGLACVSLDKVQKAIGYFKQQFEIAREIGDRRSEGNALSGMGAAHANMGEMWKAIGHYEQALAIHREIGERRGEDEALGGLGSTYLRLDEVPNAIGYFEQKLRIAREIGARQGEGAALGNLGLAYKRLGESARARVFLEQALAIGREIEYPEIIQVASQALEELGS